jgi:hypothetical protein
MARQSDRKHFILVSRTPLILLPVCFIGNDFLALSAPA